MRIINTSHKKIAIGKSVRAIQEFENGLLKIKVGEIGTIVKITVESFPDFGLFNINIVHMKFQNGEVSMGEEIALKYFKVL